MATFLSVRLRRAALLSAAVALALVVASCGGGDDVVADPAPDEPDPTVDGDADEEPAPEPDADEDDEPDGEGSTVTIAMASDITTLEHGMNSGWHEMNPLDNVYDGLTRRVEVDGEIDREAAIATDWEMSDDGLTWTLQIREGVRFHNGEELTADDVAFSINRYADPDFPGQIQSIQYPQVEGAEAVGDYTVEVHMAQPYPLFMIRTPHFSPIIPRSVAEDLPLEEFGQSPETAIGTGPYRIVEWVRDDRLVLEAFDDHWRGRPSIDRVVLRPIPDRAAAIAALRAGEVDIVESVAPDQVELLEDVDGYEVRTAAGTDRQRLILNSNRPPFEQIENRLAVVHAIDVPALIDGVLLGMGERTAGYGIPGVELYAHPDLEPYEYDPDLAREYLAEAGNPDGFTVDFHVRDGYPKAEEVAQAIAAQLAEVGIQTTMQVLQSADFVRLSEEKEIDLGYTGHAAGASFHIGTGLNIFHCTTGGAVHSGFWCHEDYDAAFDEAHQLLISDDEAARDKFYEAQEICHEHVCQGSLWVSPHIFAVNSDLDWQPIGDGNWWMFAASW